MNRKALHRLALVGLLALLLASSLAACDSGPSTLPDSAPGSASEVTSAPAPTVPAKPITPSEKQKPERTPSSPSLRLLAATVVRVVDGDTAVVRLRGGETEKVRFIGVDTPESTIEHEPYGREASRFTKSRLAGRQVFLQPGPESRDRYGRLLAYVWLERPANLRDTELRKKLFNAQLLLQGYAQLMTIPPNVDYVESFRRFQTEARERDRGLWGLSGTRGSDDGEKSSYGYVASQRSDKFHRPSCRWAKRISPDNLVRFSSPSAASKGGYAPCQVCRP